MSIEAAILVELQKLNAAIDVLIEQQKAQHAEVVERLDSICDYTGATAHGETLVVHAQDMKLKDEFPPEAVDISGTPLGLVKGDHCNAVISTDGDRCEGVLSEGVLSAVWSEKTFSFSTIVCHNCGRTV